VSEISVLEIHVSGGTLPPVPGTAAWNHYSGGPDVLLRWLETQLGLLEERPHHASRIAEYAAALDAVPEAVFSPSLTADRWGTAAELLSRRDELRLAGWDETDSPGLPPLIRDMVRAVQARPVRTPDEGGRLLRVLEALDRGQRLPPHRCILQDSTDRWPSRWRSVLERLTTEAEGATPPQAAPETALGAVQRLILAGGMAPIRSDGSLRWLRSRSTLAGCEAVATALAAEPDRLSETVVCCEDDMVALCLDGCLARLGLPTLGASLHTLAHPVLQVLPLTLRLCWEPVDPALLLDFLLLPVGPIPRRAARLFAEALVKQPGLGSAAWERAVEQLRRPDADSEGKIAERLETWLGIERRPIGQPVPAALVSEVCDRVARWARGRAHGMEEDEGADPALLEALRIAADQAAVVGDMVAARGGEHSEPQLLRLLDAAMTQGIAVQPRLEAAGGPRLIASLSELTSTCVRLVWLGLGTGDHPGSRWSALELEQCRAAGIDLDDGSRALAALREAERRGLSRVAETLLVVSLPPDEERRPHPIWLQIQGALAEADEKDPLGLEDVLATERPCDISPWWLPTVRTPVQPPPQKRPLWSVDPSLLPSRDTSSATELECRLACPLQWVFKYGAWLRPGTIARLPDDFRLKGNFCHQILSLVFGGGGAVPDPGAAEQMVRRAFTERLPLDAAPLTQPARLLEKLQLADELVRATRTLVEILRSGGYRVTGMEIPVEGTVQGRELQGSIDCLLRRDDGEEAVLDFKYRDSADRKYRRFLEQGHAVQLATYAHSRSQASGGAIPAVGYLILADGLLYTPAGSRLRGQASLTIVEGPGISEVWAAFATALQNAEEWLTGTVPIPARPLQDPAMWPAGATIVLEGPNAKGNLPDVQPICRYCDFGKLCGREELV